MPEYDPKGGPLLVEFPLVGGVDEKTDSRKVDQAKLIRGENAQISKTGVYTKRYGLSSTGTPTASGSRPFAYGTTLCAASAGTVYTHSDSFASWFSPDLLCEVTDVKQVTVVAGNTNAVDANIGTETSSGANGTICYVWRTGLTVPTDPGNVFAVIVDAITGQILSGPVQISSTNAYNPKIISVGPTYVVTWDKGNGIINAATCTVTSFPHVWTSETLIVTDSQSASPGAYDICPINSTRFMLAYEKAAGTNRCCIAAVVGIGLAIASSVTLTDSINGRTSIAVHSTVGERTWVSYVYPSGGLLCSSAAATTDGTATVTETLVPFAVDSSLATVATALGVVRYSSTTALVSYQQGFSAQTVIINTSRTITGSLRSSYGLTLASKPFVYGTKVYAMAYNVSPSSSLSPQGTAFLVDLNAEDTSTVNLRARTVAVIAPRISAPYAAAALTPVCAPQVITDSAGNVRSVTSATLTPGEPGQLSFLTTVADNTFVFDYKKRMTAELGDLVYTSGGVVQWFDGKRSAEASYFQYPAVPGTLSGAPGAGAIPNGVYAYKAIYVQRDAKGNLHRSEASPASSITLTGGNDTITITPPSYPNTLRQDAANGYAPVGIELYRTTNTGSVYYRLTDDPLPAALLNVTSLETIAPYVDTNLDGDITSNVILYTYGTPVGELGNVCPPAASILCAHRGRLWLAGCPNRKELWPSKQYSQGEAPGWNEGLNFFLEDGGDITGLASMDDKLIVFKEDKIFYITGDGPDPTGRNSDWSNPVRIVTTIGCIEPRSVVMTPFGVAYQSRVGLSLLTRSLDVVAEWGVDVEDTIAANPTITSAVVHKTRQEIRFSCMSSSTTGVELRYDYRTKQWFSTKYYDAASSARSVGACTVGANYYWTNPSTGTYWKEDSTTFLDGSTYVTMLFEFANLNLGGSQGYQNTWHVMLLGDYHTPHELLLENSIDDASYVTAKQWSAATLSGLALYHVDYHVSNTKNRSFQVRLSDLTPTSGSVGTGKGFSLASLAFETYPLPGRNRNIGSGSKA